MNNETKVESPIEEQTLTAEKGADELRRDFLRRFGGYAASAPATVYLLMSPHTAKAVGSDGAPY